MQKVPYTPKPEKGPVGFLSVPLNNTTVHPRAPLRPGDYARRARCAGVLGFLGLLQYTCLFPGCRGSEEASIQCPFSFMWFAAVSGL